MREIGVLAEVHTRPSLIRSELSLINIYAFGIALLWRLLVFLQLVRVLGIVAQSSMLLTGIVVDFCGGLLQL